MPRETMLQVLPDDSEPMADLPPLDEGDDAEGPAGDTDNLLTPLDETSDLDDEAAAMLDIGLEIEQPDDRSSDDDGGELVLDIAALLDAVDERDTDADGDASGPELFDASAGITQLEDEHLRDADARAADIALDDFGELPDLDDDGEGEAGEDADAAWLELPAEADVDEPPDWAPERWSMSALDTEAGALSALDVSGDVLVAGGDTLVALVPGAARPQHVDTNHRRVASVAWLGDRETLLYSDERGELWRVSRDFSTRESLTAFGPGPTPASVLLCRAGTAVVARTGDGWLSGSTNGGDSFAPIDVRARVVALSTGASPFVALARDRLGPTLLSSDDGGASWQQLALDSVARVLAGGDAPRVAARGDVIAIADFAIGIAVSADRGATFTRLPGTSAVTALCVGELHGRPHVFAAQLAELKGASHVLSIDAAAGTANIVAAIEGGATDEATLERVRVDALAWDAARVRLIAAGGAGVFAWQPPGVGARG